MASSSATPKLNPFRKLAHFGRETYEELRKASWPDWPELRDSTVLVILTVLLLGVFISVSDFSLYQLVAFFTHQVAR